MRTLADEGFDAYYDGELGERIAHGLATAGSAITLEDLREQRSEWTTPISTTYRGTRVTTHPPNSSGLVALEILNVLGRFEPPSAARFDGRGWSDPAWIHLQLEAAKLAFAHRDAHLADPAFRDVPVERLLSGDHAAELAARIDPSRADLDPPPARVLVGGTIYLAVVDADGNAVSLIQSNAAGFGCGVLDPATGVHFQNRGASFSLDPSSVNVLEPGKRPAHTLLPGMLFREGERRPWVVAGSMGGDIQPQIHAQLVSALVDGGADVATAVAAPRVVVEPAGSPAPPVAVFTDGELAPGVADGLLQRGHDLGRVGYDGSLGHEHAIELIDGGPADRGTLAAATDPEARGSRRSASSRRRGCRTRPARQYPPGADGPKRAIPGANHARRGPGTVVPAGRCAAPERVRSVARAAARSADGILRQPVAGCAHTDLPPASTHREGRVSSNVGQNYPYTSETESDRAQHVASLVAERADLAGKLDAETTPLDTNERWWVWKCPTTGLPGPPACRGLRPREARRLRRLRRALREDVPALAPSPRRGWRSVST